MPGLKAALVLLREKYLEDRRFKRSEVELLYQDSARDKGKFRAEEMMKRMCTIVDNQK